MDWWSVHVEARSDGSGSFDNDNVDMFADAKRLKKAMKLA